MQTMAHIIFWVYNSAFRGKIQINSTPNIIILNTTSAEEVRTANEKEVDLARRPKYIFRKGWRLV